MYSLGDKPLHRHRRCRNRVRIYRYISLQTYFVLKADVDFRMRISDMSERTFHRANLKGNARLRDFSAVSLSDSLITGVDNAEFVPARTQMGRH